MTDTQEQANIGALYAALAKAQGAMKAADKDRSVGFSAMGKDGGQSNVKYSYATLAECWDAIRKPLAENGLCVIQQVEQRAQASITVNSILGHASGQAISSELTMPVIGGTAQAVGSAITYARRYALMALVGIATDDDDDAQAASGKAEQRPARPAPPHIEPAPAPRPVAPPAPVAPPVPAPADPNAPKNNWIALESKRRLFWGKAKELGFTSDGTHKALGVERMGEYPGTLEQALGVLQAIVDRGGEDEPPMDEA